MHLLQRPARLAFSSETAAAIRRTLVFPWRPASLLGQPPSRPTQADQSLPSVAQAPGATFKSKARVVQVIQANSRAASTQLPPLLSPSSPPRLRALSPWCLLEPGPHFPSRFCSRVGLFPILFRGA